MGLSCGRELCTDAVSGKLEKLQKVWIGEKRVRHFFVEKLGPSLESRESYTQHTMNNDACTRERK